jgi:hypothetical protein
MAIVWGSWVYAGGNGMRVGLDISWSAVDYTSTSTTATVGVWTQNQYNYADAQTISYTNLGSNTNYTNNGSSGTSSLRATKTYTHTYGANPATINFRATLSGLYNGGSPTVSINSTTPTRPDPPPPPVYVPTMGTTTATAGIGYIDVAWSVSNNGGAGINYFHVYKNGAYFNQYASDVFSLRDNVGNGVTASYAVYANNSAGWSAASNTATATTVNVPTAPTSFSANTSTFGQIGLSWSAPSSNGGSSVTGYRLRTGSTLGSGTLLYEGAGTSYTHTGLSPYTDYTYNIVAVNAAGESTSTTNAIITAKSMGGICKIWNGSSWVVALPKVWNGSSWVNAQARIWDGSEWKYGI